MACITHHRDPDGTKAIGSSVSIGSSSQGKVARLNVSARGNN